MSAGTVLLGLLNGLLIGLLAVGLVLIYKSNRFLNLAHAQVGALPALLLAKVVIDWGWGWWLGLALAVVTGIGTALLVDRFVISRLRHRGASPLTLLMASVGVSQLLLALAYVPSLGPDPAKLVTYPQPFSSSWRWGHVVLPGSSILTLLLVPVLVIVLAAFLRLSALGKQIRASANNPDAARLCGINVERVSLVTWAIAGGLASVSAVLQAPNQPSFNAGALGPNLLMMTLGAAAVGAFVSLPGALLGGVALGVTYQCLAALTSSSADAEVGAFVAILAIVVARGRAIGKVFATAGSPVQELPKSVVPERLRTSALVRHRTKATVGGSLFVAVLLPLLPVLESDADRFKLTLIVIYGIVGIALTMLIGWGGQVSLGHFGIVGLGAYLTARWAPHQISLPTLLLLVGVIGAAVTCLIGLPALRVRGLTLAVTTLGFAVIAPDWLFRQGWVGSTNPVGLTVPPVKAPGSLGLVDTQLSVYYVAVAVLVLALGTSAALRRSSPGRLIVAVRDNERAAGAMGVTSATMKLTVLGVSGFWAGTAGALWAMDWGLASTGQFTANVSIAVLAVPVIGGLGSLWGAVAAAGLLYGLTFFVGPYVSPVFGSFGSNVAFQLFLSGALLLVVLLRLPQGLAGVTQALWQAFLYRRAAATTAGGTEATLIELPLAVKGVKVRFGGVTALDGPDLEVRPGEVLGLIGANGAGKTTLMNVVSGLLKPDEGSVRIFGREVSSLPADLRAGCGVARSFQDASLFSGLTVTETLQVALACGHKTGIVPAMFAAPWVRVGERATRKQAAELMERFGLTPYADALTSELSTGSRRICDLAAQVAMRPKLLLLDEPTGGVAQREAEAFVPLVRRIRDELDCAVLIIEHDMPLLMKVCDRLVVMEAGRVIAQGSPEEIRNNPAVIASYLGNDEAAIHRSQGGPVARRPHARPTASAPS